MSEKPDKACHIAMVAYPRLTQLDLTGPYEILARMPGATVDLVWSSRDPIVSDTGLTLVPTATFEDCPQPEILFVPGGPGQVDVMENVTLIGTQGDETIPLPELAAHAGTIPWEILCSVTKRVPRLYKTTRT